MNQFRPNSSLIPARTGSSACSTITKQRYTRCCRVVVGFGTRGSGRRQSPPPFVVDVPAVHHLHQRQDSSGINEGHQPTARAAFTNGKPRFQKSLEPLDFQLITPEIERGNRLACLKPRPEI